LSQRFGRNQRRRARELAQQLRTEAEGLRVALTRDKRSLREQASDIEAMRQQLREAVRILGPNSAALPPTKLRLPGKGRPRVALGGWTLPPLGAPGDTFESSVVTRHELKVLFARLKKDPPTGMVHARVEFDDRQYGYGISDEAIQTMPADLLARRIGEEITELLVQQIRGVQRGRY
jgi:hypothetical protein